MPTVRIDREGRVTLPADVRRHLGVEPGDRVMMTVEGEGLVVRRPPMSCVTALAALFEGFPKDFDHELEAARDEWDQ